MLLLLSNSIYMPAATMSAAGLQGKRGESAGVPPSVVGEHPGKQAGKRREPFPRAVGGQDPISCKVKACRLASCRTWCMQICSSKQDLPTVSGPHWTIPPGLPSVHNTVPLALPCSFNPLSRLPAHKPMQRQQRTSCNQMACCIFPSL